MDTGAITGWHAHVYFDTASEADAEAVRAAIDEQFDVTLGRWHHKLVGPHTQPMYQIAFSTTQFDSFVPWLAMNRRGLTVLVHPETDDPVADHTDRAMWMGEVLAVNTDVLRTA